MSGDLRYRTLRDIRLAINAAQVLLEARFRLRYMSVENISRWATLEGERSCAREQLLIAFRRAAARLGGTCLVRALALQRFLSTHGHPSELRLGVGRTERGFEAHAWLVAGEELLEGAGREAEEFTLLTSWPAGYRF